MSDRPVLRLLPKVNPNKFRRGTPWAYSNEVVMDRRTRALKPGTVATLVDGERNPLVTVAVNANSKIVARILDNDPDAEFNPDWVRKQLGRALSLRQTLYDTPFYRLCHSEGDGLSGLVIDRYGDVVAVQPNAAWAEAMIDEVAESLVELTGARAVYKNAASRARKLEGLDDHSVFVTGSCDEPLPVPMNGATYFADIVTGQKTGLFFDQRENHAFAARLAKDRDVLDVFCHVGGFGLASLAAGARSCVAIDGSAAALELAEKGAAQMGFGERYTTQKSDAVKAMRARNDASEKYGLVVCDPPAFAPHADALASGLRGYEVVAMAAAQLVEPGGYLVLCSCSQAANLTDFRNASLKGIGRAGRLGAIIHTGFAGPDHPVHPHLAAQSYLKALFFRLD